MHPDLQELLKAAPVITDGAWGTQMQLRGLPVGAPPDPWNLERPDLVCEVATSYIEAGSRVILTNTFGANRVTLERHGLADRVREINAAGVRISKRAAEGRALVFASIGPTGRIPSMDEIGEEALAEAFREQVAGLAEGGADGIVIETMSDPLEAAIAVRCAAEAGLPVVACMTFGSGRTGDRTIMGTTPEQAAESLLDAGADLVGANCGQGPETMRAVVERLGAAGGLPVWAKANAGLPRMEDGRAVYDETPEQFLEAAGALMDAGAAFVGGCCGTSPEFIRLLAERAGGRR